MTYAPLSPAGTPSTGTPAILAELRRFALRLVGPLRVAHRRLLLRQRLESLPDRLLADIGVAREEVPEAVRCWVAARPQSGAGGLRGR